MPFGAGRFIAYFVFIASLVANENWATATPFSK
jgi:hypothetical protein